MTRRSCHSKIKNCLIGPCLKGACFLLPERKSHLLWINAGSLMESFRLSFLFLAKPGRENRLVNGKNNNHGYTAGYDGRNNIPDPIRHMKSGRYGIPDAGEEIHDEEYAQCSGKVAENLGDHRAFAPEGDVSL